MRLTVLGGSAAIPNAGAGCAGFLVEHATPDGTTIRIALDLGPGTLLELRRHLDLRDLDAVVVTHLHVDHVLDVVALRHGLAFTPEPRSSPLPVWLPPGGESLLRAALAPLEAWLPGDRFDRAVELRQYVPTAGLRVGALSLAFAPTVHDVPCWAVRVAAGGATLVYGADGGPASHLAPFARGADLLIAEATLIEGDGDPARGSMTAAEAGQLAAAAGVRRLLLTHIWQEHGLDAQRRVAASAYDGPIIVARPGIVAEV